MTIPTDLDTRFRDAAARSGLLDAGYDVVESPLGPLFVAATEQGLLRIYFDADPEQQLELLARAAGARVLRSAGRGAAARRARDAACAGRRPAGALSIDLRRAAPFTAEVLDQLARVPYGQTATYGELAARVGHPRAARAVGTVMNRNPVPIVLPCHRVVGASGSLVGYGGGLERKEQLLRLEGALL